MSNAAKHRKKAAEFEQLRQIDRAITLYARAIEESELAGEDVDVALLNKVGDLALRQGRVPDAITYYERAVEHYASSGLFNHAIALCNKILRNAPGRANVYFTLGRICARKGLRGDATRNFLEYATRVQQEGRVDEGMRALAEVADLMPELTEVRCLVDDHADRAGIVLPRRRTPSSASMALSEERAPSTYRDKSQDLIFLEVDYDATVSRPTPVRSPRMPPLVAIVPAFTVDEPSTAVPVSLPAALDAAAAVMPIIDDAPVAALRAPFRIDPHDFMLQGELPPLVLDDELVKAGIAALGVSAASATVDSEPLAGGAEIAPAAAAAAVDVVDEPESLEDSSDDVVSAQGPGMPADAPVAEGRPVSVTPALPIAAVAAEATLVATSRRTALRAAVAKLPKDWLLRRRLAEALFEAGERDAGLAELEAAQHGLIGQGDLQSGADIADTLVQVVPERVAFHQKRVELSVRMQDQGRLRVAYLDLADALVRIGEESRARAVYTRVLEIDSSDGRAREALGSAASPPPPKPGSDANFVDLAEWLRDDDASASTRTRTRTRMRMREPAISGDEQSDFDALLRHFKEGVARSPGEDDHESHYDLGVAYKGMGLLDDAIEEFQKALRSRSHRLPAYEALGQGLVEQGRYLVAATVLSRALHEPGLDDEQRVGVLYLLAYSCEALQRWDEAHSYYQRVYATDIHFRDAAARLAALDQVAR